MLPIIATVGGDYGHFRRPRPQLKKVFARFFQKALLAFCFNTYAARR
jgi:hypothetical protein